jgi:hypothetical protein
MDLENRFCGSLSRCDLQDDWHLAVHNSKGSNLKQATISFDLAIPNLVHQEPMTANSQKE